MARVFYGWRIVAVAFVCDFVATGFLFYSYGIFFKAMAADFGGSRLGVSLGLGLVNLVGGLAAPFVGRAVDRLPIRRIMLAGALASSVGYALISRVDALWQYYALLGTFIALGNLGMANITSQTLVANWFVARRGRALGIATMGISLSGVVMPLVATWLVTRVGWRGGMLVFAVATLLLVMPLVAAVVVKRPEDLGLEPDGAEPPAAGAPPTSERVWASAELLREPRFWVLVATFGLGMFAVSGILTHLRNHLTDLGIGPWWAASALSLAASLGVLGKYVFGALADRGDPRMAVWTSFGAQLGGLLLIMTRSDGLALAAGAGAFGLGMGGLVPLNATLAGQAFGRLSYGKAMGLMRPFQIPLHAAGVPLAGWAFDATGSYDLAFQIYVVAFLLAAAAVSRFR